ncbi:hypothetical protein BROUX41_005924 [Berkeleyomyces rouxiae]|uniref:uncharacterized protein n=1 Tax=Berkeleyomyces rouxiae TaxID=2035830 RepID=UPI003B766F68
MHLQTLPLLLASAFTHAAVSSGSQNSSFGSSGYIIEFDHSNLKARDRLASVEGVEIVHQFDSHIFSGASIRSSSHNIDTLRSVDGVVGVWKNNVLKTHSVEAGSPRSYTPPADRVPIGKTWHVPTGVQELHGRGITGKGVKVAILDGGIDYNHEALGGGFGPGFKVVGGHDFLGDSNGYPEPTPDSDPMDTDGHGTKVAGIVAGNTSWYKGVAPDATLYAYRVFTSVSMFWSEDILIKGSLQAYNDGVDIIAASLGATGGFSDNAWAVVASRLVDEGLIFVTSNANNGEAGPFLSSSIAGGENVLGVAAALTEDYPASAYNLKIDGETIADGYVPSLRELVLDFPESIVDWPIVPMTLESNPTADACTPYPNGTASLKGKIPLVRRGGCLFVDKQNNLAELGAEYIFFYNYDATPIVASTSENPGMYAVLTSDSAEVILDAVRAGKHATASFNISSPDKVGLPKPFKSGASDSTSWGGLADLQVKPDIAGPGVDIYMPSLNNTWMVENGTSMACPYVAGVAALYISVYGGRDVQGKGFAKRLIQRIISSGNSLPWGYNVPEYKAPIGQVGTGMIDALKVLDYTSELEFEKIALNDTKYFNGHHEFTVVNRWTEPVTYDFSVEAAAGIEILTGLENDVHIKSRVELVPISLEPTVRLPQGFTLQPGSSKTVSVEFENPESLGWNTATLPNYSGKILVHSSLDETMSIPYFGLAGDLHGSFKNMFRQGYPTIVSTLNNTPIAEKSTFTFNLSLEAQDFPRLSAGMAFASREARWDVFEPNYDESLWVYPPTVGQNGYIGSIAFQSPSAFTGTIYDPNAVYQESNRTFPTDLARDTDVATGDNSGSLNNFLWLGRLSNGSEISSGNYTLRFATLRPFGDRSDIGDWNIYTTPNVIVDRI